MKRGAVLMNRSTSYLHAAFGGGARGVRFARWTGPDNGDIQDVSELESAGVMKSSTTMQAHYTTKHFNISKKDVQKGCL